MKMKGLFFFLLFISVISIAYSQESKNDSIIIDDYILDKIVELNNQLFPSPTSDSIIVDVYDWTNMKIYYSSVDLSAWDTLVEKGNYDEKGQKTGTWIEFPIDTSDLNDDAYVRYDTSIAINFKPELLKYTGEYIQGKRDGVWILYKFDERQNQWMLNRTEPFQMGIKQGVEKYFIYSFFPPDIPSIEVEYANDKIIEMRTLNIYGNIETRIKRKRGKYIRYFYNENGKIINKEKGASLYF